MVWVLVRVGRVKKCEGWEGVESRERGIVLRISEMETIHRIKGGPEAGWAFQVEYIRLCQER